jgi:hypothetical protein
MRTAEESALNLDKLAFCKDLGQQFAAKSGVYALNGQVLASSGGLKTVASGRLSVAGLFGTDKFRGQIPL